MRIAEIGTFSFFDSTNISVRTWHFFHEIATAQAPRNDIRGRPTCHCEERSDMAISCRHFEKRGTPCRAGTYPVCVSGRQQA